MDPLIELVQRKVTEIAKRPAKDKDDNWCDRATLTCGHEALLIIDMAALSIGDNAYCPVCQAEDKRLYEKFKAKIKDELRRGLL